MAGRGPEIDLVCRLARLGCQCVFRADGLWSIDGRVVTPAELPRHFEVVTNPHDARPGASWVKAGNILAGRVAAEHGFRLAEIVNGGRSQPLASVRQEVYLALREAGYTLSEIGQLLGRDHSTVKNGCYQARLRRQKEAS